MTTRCWTDDGAHYFIRESDGVWVCQICGEVKPKRRAVSGQTVLPDGAP